MHWKWYSKQNFGALRAHTPLFAYHDYYQGNDDRNSSDLKTFRKSTSLTSSGASHQYMIFDQFSLTHDMKDLELSSTRYIFPDIFTNHLENELVSPTP